MRGHLDHIGWAHHDIPVGICIKCEHRVYRDEPHSRHSFTDASGNNASDYEHKECQPHKIKKVKVIEEYRCLDCGVVLRDEKQCE